MVHFLAKNYSNFSCDFDTKVQNEPVEKMIRHLKSDKKVNTRFYIIIWPLF